MGSDTGSVAPHTRVHTCTQASHPEETSGGETSGSPRVPCRTHNPTEQRADDFGAAIDAANAPVLAVEPEIFNSLPVHEKTVLPETQVVRPRHVAARHALFSRIQPTTSFVRLFLFRDDGPA